MEKKKLYIATLGCTKNLVDSEVMIAKLQNEYELSNEPENADLLLVNTCGFITPAKEESIETIFELHENRKEDSTLVVSGCLSERYKEDLQKEITEVDLFTGVGDYDKIAEMLSEKKSIFSDKAYLIDGEERVITGSRTHAYIKISEGCNQNCSFCAIPSFKGKLQSREIESIADEVEKLTQKGFYDFSFISQDSSSFRRDFGEKDGLEKLVERIEKIEGVLSARILYLYPSTTSDNLIAKIGESKKFHNYFDLPIQHISAKMLKTMKRGVSKKRHLEILDQMRNLKNSFLRTSFIVGHPEESEDDFNEILELIQNFRFDMINIFQYSHEEGTSAFKLEEVPEEIIVERVQKIEEIVEKQRVENLEKLVGTEIDLILNGESDEHEYLLSAKAIHWAEEIDGEILINDKEVKEVVFGKIYLAEITEIAGDRLLGTLKKSL
ncbi:ribosomal protein S12 methylthiotransferase RimO [Thiovulum sp. ES]|nr:ribosomal protein S12 methylthiotransferase RimO [Thiovulum sp. ES]